MNDVLAARRNLLESLYNKFTKKCFIHPDPLEAVHRYRTRRDREVVGLIAACLAFGHVRVIQQSIDNVLDRLGRSAPAHNLFKMKRPQLRIRCRGFRHRWIDGVDLEKFLWAIRCSLERYGSLEAAACLSSTVTTLCDHRIAKGFIDHLCECGNVKPGPLLSDPKNNSAFKRIHLYFRWMVRKDTVDLGVWRQIRPCQLLFPIDRHMLDFGQSMGLTTRRTADGRTALEITDQFRLLCPEDPVRYDFSLTRLGIRNADDEKELFMRQWHALA